MISDEKVSPKDLEEAIEKLKGVIAPILEADYKAKAQSAQSDSQNQENKS